MQRYSKRPPPAEPLPLGTGDFDAVSYPAVPGPPRAPVFQRSMPQPHGYGFAQPRYPAHYSHVPAAPHSLSPVEMSSVRSANATGPQRAQPTVVIRSRPSMKMGVSILVAGALIGAVFGVGMRVRQNTAEAAFAAQLQQQEQEEQQQVAFATPPPQAPAAPVVLQPTAGPAALPQGPAALPQGPAALPQGPAALPQGPAALPQGPAALPPNAYAGVPFGSLVVPAQTQPAQVAHVAPQAPARAQAAPMRAAPAAPTPAATPKAPQKQAAWSKPAGGGHPSLGAKVNAPAKADKDKDDGYKVASANNDEPTPKKKPAKEPVAAKDEPKETKRSEARASKSSGSSKGSDDADKVLRAAMGATENTL